MPPATPTALPNAVIPLDEFRARAILLGPRLDVGRFSPPERLAMHPLTVRVGESGVAVLFRYGAVVLFNVPDTAEAAFLDQLAPLIQGAATARETEELQIAIDAGGRETMEADRVCLADADVIRFQLVAEVLSKSVVLAEYETLVSQTFEQIEPLAIELQRHGRASRDARRLLRQIGQSLLSEHRMIGRAEIRDKPEVLWERPDLEKLYVRLEDELEISERYSILERKLELISRTASTVLDLLHTQLGLRLEWYIVILILVEIVMFGYDLFFRG
jgi:uncharacterized Rmd1/YagE family protein